MATASELLAQACSSGIACLGEMDLLRVIAQGSSTGGGGGGGGGTLSTDATMGGATPSDALYPSQKAAKTYIDNGDAATLATADSLYVKKTGDTMTGALLQPAGTAALPALARSTDPDTGLWYPGANLLALSTGGTERLRIIADGKVGMGITVPLASLHVTPSASGTNYFRVDHSDGTPRIQAGTYPGGPLLGVFWLGNATPAAGNYSIMGDASATVLNGPTALYFAVNDTALMQLAATGLIFVADNTYDIGANGANRPRTLYLATSAKISDGTISKSPGMSFNFDSGIIYNSLSQIVSPADGILLLFNNAATGFDRLQFGGTTSSFPSIKRSSAVLQARLADDSAYAGFEAGTIGAGGVVSATTFLNLAAGTTAASALRFVQGAAPTAPVDGDMWREDNTNTGLKIRINGVTKTITVA